MVGTFVQPARLDPEPVPVQRAQRGQQHLVGQLGVEPELVDRVVAGQAPAQEGQRHGLASSPRRPAVASARASRACRGRGRYGCRRPGRRTRRSRPSRAQPGGCAPVSAAGPGRRRRACGGRRSAARRRRARPGGGKPAGAVALVERYHLGVSTGPSASRRSIADRRRGYGAQACARLRSIASTRSRVQRAHVEPGGGEVVERLPASPKRRHEAELLA